MNVYYYIYYRIYRLLERTSFPWWSDFKAGFLIAAIEMALLALLEYKVALFLSAPVADTLGKWGYVLILGAPPLLLNYFLFLYGDRWKEIVDHFDGADRKEKSKMNLQMAVVLILVVGVFTFLFMV